jgi:hypothetical protein
MAVAQKMGRRWIGCDINLGAIQTSTKRLNQIIDEQKVLKGFTGLRGFKVLNVNEYTAFKNEIEAKEIVLEMYGVEEIKRDAEIIEAFNKQVGNTGWTTSRGIYLSALHKELDNRGFDFSAIGTSNSLSFKNKVILIGKKVEIDAK